MKILVLANSDIYSCCALNHLLPNLTTDNHKINLWLSGQVGDQKNAPTALKNLKHFEQTIFHKSIFPTLEDSRRNARHLSFKQLAENFCDRQHEVENEPNVPATLEILKGLSPDLVLSIRYGKILKSAFLKIPKHGTLNLHSGKLPEYPGVMATFRAMLNSDRSIHTTLHSIDDRNIDQGDIVAMSTTPLDLTKCYFSNTLSLYKEGATLLEDAVRAIHNGKKLLKKPQQPSKHYYSFPDKNELKNFHAKGLSLIDERAVNTLIQSHFTAG